MEPEPILLRSKVCLHDGSASHNVIPDRIEAGTFMVAAAMTGGDVYLENVIAEHNEPVTAKLREAGAFVEPVGDKVHVWAKGAHFCREIVKTLPYPGYPTDMQASDHGDVKN